MKTKENNKYWEEDSVNGCIKGQKGEIISFKSPAITISKRQQDLLQEVLIFLNKKYKINDK